MKIYRRHRRRRSSSARQKDYRLVIVILLLLLLLLQNFRSLLEMVCIASWTFYARAMACTFNNCNVVWTVNIHDKRFYVSAARNALVPEAQWFWVCPSVSESVSKSVRPENLVNKTKPMKGISPNFCICVYRCANRILGSKVKVTSGNHPKNRVNRIYS